MANFPQNKGKNQWRGLLGHHIWTYLALLHHWSTVAKRDAKFYNFQITLEFEYKLFSFYYLLCFLIIHSAQLLSLN